MNKENINIIKQKHSTLFEDHVSCNMFHDYITSQVNQYPVFTVRCFPLFSSLGVEEIIPSDVTSYSEDFIAHIDRIAQKYTIKICENALK